MKAPLIALILTLAAGAAEAAQAAGVEVARAWSRPATAGATGAGFMSLANRGTKADALVGISSPVAAQAMVHRTTLSGGVASMQHVSRVELAPGATVSFAPGGYHVMFVGLKTPLKPGDSLPATLTFASGRKLSVTFAVRVTPPAAK